MQDYDHLAQAYAPEMAAAKLVEHNGDEYRVEMRLRKHEVITAVLEGIAEIRYGTLDGEHAWSVSRMDRITDESGSDHGLLWRMNTYWRFEQAEDGVFLECEVVSLTRAVPAGLGWAVGPFVSSVPKESMEFTLERTRAAIEKNNQGGGYGKHGN